MIAIIIIIIISSIIISIVIISIMVIIVVTIIISLIMICIVVIITTIIIISSSSSSTGVCEMNAPFVQALAKPPSSRNPSPAPEFIFFKLVVPRVLFSGGLFFHSHRYG